MSCHGWLVAALTFGLSLPQLSPAQQFPPDEERQRLLAPKSLPHRAPANLAEIRRWFRDPPAEYRSMPLWVWNDLQDSNRLREMLQQFKQQGMGGVFIHPRPGLMTEYLGTDWFRLWKQAVEEGKRLGLLVNIYDENSYPSGFAGGHVPSRVPDTAAQYVQAELGVSPNTAFRQRGTSVSIFAATVNGNGQVTAARRISRREDLPAGQQVLLFRLRRASGNPWTGEFPYVDLTNPQTAAAFLDTTYEAYKREVGSEFGKTVRWSFSDEPLIATGGAYDTARLALPLGYHTLSEFQKRNGYDLADHLPALYWDVGDFRKVRFDYWQTLHDLWKENFMRPMFLWCDRNRLQFTGHWMEHEWPFPWITPADANLYAYQHLPGIDMLEGTRLRQQGSDPHMLFTIKQVASVSHQLGRRAFCEAYGVAGWDSTFEHYKRFGDWLMVHGINFMNQHLAFTTIRGARKRDHPQSFTDHSAWWSYYRLHGDHLGRFSMLSSLSEPANRLLVLQQTTSGFLLARRGASTPELDRMRSHNAELNQYLADHQMDFDLGDEYMIEWFGAVRDRKFHVAKAAYELLVIPPDMDNLRHQTLPLLAQWLAAGGQVLAMSDTPRYVDGRADTRPADLQRRYPGQWRRVASPVELLASIRKQLPSRITFAPEPANLGFAERRLNGGDRILFLANSGLSPSRTRLTAQAGGLEVWDTVSGEVRPASFTRSGAHVSLEVDMAPASSLVLVARTTPIQPAAPSRPSFSTTLPSGEWTVHADAPNLVALDHCDIRIGNESFTGVNTWQANWTLWQRHGFERPAWDNAVQYRTRIFDRNHFAADSGFDATYRFQAAAPSVLAGLQLALESPELYRVTVNGVPVEFANGERWLDPHIRAVSIERQSHAGENLIRISGRPFDVKMELENIYLRGNFRVEPAAEGFRLNAPGKLGFGSWAKQGLPFYADAVTYQTRISVPSGNNTLRIQLREWQGSVAVVLVDGKESARLGWPPYQADVPVSPGEHTIALRIVSTPRNTYGPFHHPDKPRMRAWPAAWAVFPDHQPPGSAYDFVDYGLITPPTLLLGAR